MNSTAIKRISPTTELILPPQYSLADMKLMSESVAKSGLFKMDASQVLTLMLLAESEGLHPIKALMRYHIIEGRPSMRSDAMLAEFQRSGGRIEWTKDTDTECEATFYHDRHCPDGKSVSFTMKDAERAGLANRLVWKNHPRPMLRSRVITNGIRMISPGVIMGIYMPDEIEEFATPTEQTAHASLTAKLKQRREPTPPAEPPAKPPEAPPQPTKGDRSDCRDWIEDTLTAFNAEATAKDRDFKPIHAHQIGNHLIKQLIANGFLKEDELTGPAGKRDKHLVADAINDLWRNDQMAVMREVGDYLGQKMPAFSDEDSRELGGAE
jgi:hypothetical protein